MKTPLSFLLFSLLAIGASPALAQNDTDDDTAFLAKYGNTLEVPGAVAAKDFVPADCMSGPLHTVRAEAYNDGLVNTYFIETKDGVIQVAGTPALIERVREIYALDYLLGVSRSDEFGKAVAQAGKAKLQSAGNAISDPVGTIQNIPKGASRFFGRIGEGMKGGKSNTEGGALQDITGTSLVKVKLAVQLGVDPYSTNEQFQETLTKVAEAKAGGGLVLNIGVGMVPGGTFINANQNLQDTLVNSTPSDLRIINRKKLFALGVDRKLADQLLMHPWYSPWQATATVAALSQIGVNPKVFLTHAVQALTPEDAFYFQRLAQILAKYHTTATPLRAIRFDCGVITALDKNGTLVVPVSLDYGIWAERAARRSEEFAAMDREKGKIKKFALWADGKLSPRLCEELKKRDISWSMNVLDTPVAPAMPAATPAPSPDAPATSTDAPAPSPAATPAARIEPFHP